MHCIYLSNLHTQDFFDVVLNEYFEQLTTFSRYDEYPTIEHLSNYDVLFVRLTPKTLEWLYAIREQDSSISQYNWFFLFDYHQFDLALNIIKDIGLHHMFNMSHTMDQFMYALKLVTTNQL
ncbi:hypothetical protein ACTWQB_16720, partial [Piscibacillus sp. B03]|uniref:hypothetical protein n=1 Tax=Piscibacillus sp. B03 TaxID=3457430 RepID=UPI003FCE5154